MTLEELIAGLSRPEAYPYPVRDIQVRQTHISVVFLAGDRVYKLKKPVRLEFLDFSSPARRKHFCEEEVRLNRRLAPGVYRGVVPVTVANDQPKFGAPGTAMDWAVEMERLPDEATLEQYLARGKLDPAIIVNLAHRLAAFHREAAAGPDISRQARYDRVSRNALDNFNDSAAHVGVTVTESVLARLRQRTEAILAELRPLIEARADAGIPRDTHGDLHLDHVYLFPERRPPGDIVAIDCIEFNDRFRYADPVSDVAFLIMDMAFHGHRELAAGLGGSYLAAAHDAGGHRLVRFYVAYRACVRAKVQGIKALEPEVPAPERDQARESARGHWLFALAELESPGRRPCLILIGGLPGTGKSSLAEGLAAKAGFDVIRSDIVRKEIAGQAQAKASALGEGIYTEPMTQRTYDECARRAKAILSLGRRVIVDATFAYEWQRRLLIGAGLLLGVPVRCLICQAPASLALSRIRERRGDVSDANANVFEQMAARWEPPAERTSGLTTFIDTARTPEEALRQAIRSLSEAGLADSSS
jgi:aminoglycoside phosphotransferase family enzyme/predicted kinase